MAKSPSGRRPAKKKPQLRMNVIRAILDEFLKRNRKKLAARDRGMERLIATLRGTRKRGKMSKAGRFGPEFVFPLFRSTPNGQNGHLCSA